VFGRISRLVVQEGRNTTAANYSIWSFEVGQEGILAVAGLSRTRVLESPQHLLETSRIGMQFPHAFTSNTILAALGLLIS
jgi:hypothetical protein